MKKLLLVALVFGGAVTAARAGVNVHIGIGLPVPPPVIITHRAPVYAPAYVAPAPVCAPAPVVIAKPTVIVPNHKGKAHRYTYEHRKGRPVWHKRSLDGNKYYYEQNAPQYGYNHHSHYSDHRGYDHDRSGGWSGGHR